MFFCSRLYVIDMMMHHGQLRGSGEGGVQGSAVPRMRLRSDCMSMEETPLAALILLMVRGACVGVLVFRAAPFSPRSGIQRG